MATSYKTRRSFCFLSSSLDFDGFVAALVSEPMSSLMVCAVVSVVAVVSWLRLHLLSVFCHSEAQALWLMVMNRQFQARSDVQITRKTNYFCDVVSIADSG